MRRTQAINHIITPGKRQFNPAKLTVILDRDGVLNVDLPNYVKSPKEIKLIPTAASAIAILNQLNYNIFLATNQQCINKGLATANQIVNINDLILDATYCHPVEIHICPHLVSQKCSCRKPAPGMLQAILDRYQIPKEKALFVGDKLTDLQAAQAINISFHLVMSGEWQGDPNNIACDVFSDLLEVAQYLKQNAP